MTNLPSGGPRSHYLIDTNIKNATCDRCGCIVWSAHSGGVPVVVDLEPLDGLSGLRAALLAGRSGYRLTRAAGRPWRLQSVHRHTNLETSELVAAHGCTNASVTILPGQDEDGDRPKDGMLPVTLNPRPHPATSGATQGGNRNGANVRNSEDLIAGHAPHATPRPSDPVSVAIRAWRPAICLECRVFFEPDTEYVAWYVSPSQWWAMHANGCSREKRRT